MIPEKVAETLRLNIELAKTEQRQAIKDGVEHDAFYWDGWGGCAKTLLEEMEHRFKEEDVASE